MKKYLGALALLALAGAASAAPKVEADPTKDYLLTPEVGPFVICVKGYTGPNARTLAHTLVIHTRRQGYAAYLFDRSAEARREAEEMLKQRYASAPELAKRRKIRIEENWGVLVGGYRDLESASKDVEKVKKLSWDDLAKTKLDIVPDSRDGKLYAVSPYAYAFATRNPLVPAPKADPSAPDPAWKDLNAGRPYNLLKCGKSYTLAVKQFAGVNVVQPRSAFSPLTEALWGKSGETLDASARQAEEVARFLRSYHKLDAYVLHTRGASIVTIGAFDGPEDKEMLRMQQTLSGQLRQIESKIAPDPRTADLYRFFPQPMPMKVPQL